MFGLCVFTLVTLTLTLPVIFNYLFQEKSLSLTEQGEYANLFPSSDIQVLLLSTQSCQYCESTRAYFKSNNIKFLNLDIQKSEDAAKKFKLLKGQGVPIVISRNQIIRGYSPELMNQMFAISMSKFEKN